MPTTKRNNEMTACLHAITFTNNNALKIYVLNYY